MCVRVHLFRMDRKEVCGPGLLRHQEHSVWGGPEGALSPLLHLIMTLGGQQHASSLEKAKLERIGQAPEL